MATELTGHESGRLRSVGVLQERVYGTRIRDVDHLKQRLSLIEEWSHFDQRIINRAVHQWRVRLRECLSKTRPL